MAVLQTKAHIEKIFETSTILQLASVRHPTVPYILFPISANGTIENDL